MRTPPDWYPEPPCCGELTHGFLTEPESLTERLLATGRRFGVDVLFQGNNTAIDDELPLLNGERTVFARHVSLTLDGVAVVRARSVCRLGCPHWQGILDRGSRSLGLTLFGNLPQLARGTLAFSSLPPSDPRHPHDDITRALPARRCLFRLHGAPLIVTELFLPALERMTPC